MGGIDGERLRSQSGTLGEEAWRALAEMGEKIIRVRSGKIEEVIINEHPMNVEDIEY